MTALERDQSVHLQADRMACRTRAGPGSVALQPPRTSMDECPWDEQRVNVNNHNLWARIGESQSSIGGPNLPGAGMARVMAARRRRGSGVRPAQARLKHTSVATPRTL